MGASQQDLLRQSLKPRSPVATHCDGASPVFTFTLLIYYLVMSTLTTYKDPLTRFVAHQSISTDPAFIPQCVATAEALSEWLEQQGFTSGLIVTSTQHPLVLASYTHNPEAPTCLVYGHYDVQPANREDGWSQDPFTLTELNGKLVGRGSTDNKGQFLIHLATIAELIKTGELTRNIQVLLEGDEENGSEGITHFLKTYPERITATTALISDGELIKLRPVLDIGFRGTVQIDVKLGTSTQDLHSGLFGGTVPNAALELSRLLSTMYGEQGALSVAGITDGIHQPSTQEKEWADAGSPEMSEYLALTGTRAAWSEPGETLGSQRIFRPTIEIIGMGSGYMGAGFRNSISATAAAKLNVRVCPGQDTDHIYEVIKTHLTQHAPDYVTVTTDHDSHSDGTLVDTTAPVLTYAAKILEEAYGMAPTRAFCGASLPFLEGFQAVPNLALVIAPLANDDCLMHAVGENIAIANIEKGLAFSKAFFSQLPS